MASPHASVAGKKRTMYYERSNPNPVNYASQITVLPGWQKHHILPCTSVRKSIATVTKQAGKENLEKALKYFTNWNINESHNLIGLPTRSVYQKAYGKRGGKQNPSLSLVASLGNLPCHQPTSWGHTVYNDKIETQLQSVWKKVVMTVKQHKLDANDIAGDITAIETRWKGTFPGSRQTTQANWRAMQQGHPTAYNNFTMVKLGSSPI